MNNFKNSLLLTARKTQGALIPAIAASFLLAAAIQAQSDWQPVRCVPMDLPPELLFDVVTPVAGFETNSPAWKALSGSQQAKAEAVVDGAEHHGGSSALRVNYEFEGRKELEYVLLNGPVSFPQSGLGFGCWLKTDGTAFLVRLRVTDVSGECHQFDMLSTPSTNWQFVACSLDSQSAAWGGDGNKRLDYPCKLDGILIDRPREHYVGKGTFWVDDAAVIRKAQSMARSIKLEVQDRHFGNVYGVGDSVSIRASGDGDRLRWRVVDFFGGELGKGEGAAGGTQIQFALKQSGWFCCQVDLVQNGRVVSSGEFPCAALPGGAELSRSDFVGVCTHFGHNAYSLETMDLMKRFGIDQFRDEISWGAMESQKGTYAVPTFAQGYLKHAAELKVRPLLIFDYANRNYDNGGFPNSPEAIEAFSRYAVELVKQTRGTVTMFEVWNEWVGGCGMEKRPGTHDGDAYGRLLKQAYAAVKKAYPEVTVIGIGGEFGAKCSETIVSAIQSAGTNSMDGWSIHPYRYPHSPEYSELVGEVNRIKSSVAQTGERSHPWVTEIGYPTHRGNGGSDEHAQARYAVRTLALLQSAGVQKTFWYDFKDDGLTRDYNENNFGLIHHQEFNCAPKPGIVAMSAFVRFTGGTQFMELRRPNGVYVASYKKQGEDVLLIWCEEGRRGIELKGEVAGKFDLMGAPIAGAVMASGYPIYVMGRGVSVTVK